MRLQVLYSALVVLGLVTEIVLLVVLLVRRQYRTFPVFTIYIAFDVLTDIGIGILFAGASKSVAQSVSISLLPPQYFLEVMVLLEIAWHVLRPVHVSLSRRALQIFALSLGLAVLCGTLLAWHVDNTGSPIYEKVKGPLDLTVGLLRMLIFAVTAGFAQLLGIGWKNKVLRLATALSFYSAVSLILSLVQSHTGPSETLDRLRAANFMFELVSLLWVFTTKDVRRREFSPQMEQFLVTLAGRAKLARSAVVRMQVK